MPLTKKMLNEEIATYERLIAKYQDPTTPEGQLKGADLMIYTFEVQRDLLQELMAKYYPAIHKITCPHCHHRNPLGSLQYSKCKTLFNQN